MSEPISHFNPEDMQTLRTRFAKARWIADDSNDTVMLEGAIFWFTPLGRERMRQFSHIAPQLFGSPTSSPSATSITQILELILAWEGAEMELQPPALSDGESQTLYGLILCYAKNEAV
jgi:hypothetical protein